MSVFDLNDSPAVWFDYPTGGRVQLRTLSPGDWVAVRKATVKKSPFVATVDGKAQLFEREVVDEELQRQMVNDLTIVGWEGFTFPDKTPIPVTLENKSRLMLMKDSAFRDFVNAKMTTLAELETAKAEALRKN